MGRMPSAAEPPRAPSSSVDTRPSTDKATRGRTREGHVPEPRRDTWHAPGTPGPHPRDTPDTVPVESPSRRRYWALLLPALTLLALVTRLPSFARPLWNPDEGFLATQARMLADGGTLYDTVVDRKPPLLPWLYQGAFALAGDESLWPLKAAAVLAVAVGAAFVASLARRRWGDRAGWTAGVLYVLLTIGLNPEDTQAATFEVFMLPWTAAAVWCADRRRWAWAGLGIAGAVLTKQTGGAVLLPVLVLLWRAPAPRLPGLARLAAGAVLPVAITALAFGPGRFLYWMATGSGAYASVEGAGLRALARALASTGVLALACAPFLVALVHLWLRRRRPEWSADLWAWLAASAAAIVVGFQFFGHYYLQLVPPLALLGASVLRELRRPRHADLALALTAAIAAGHLVWGYAAPRTELDHAQRVAAEVRARTQPSDRVLLWGMHPEGYWLADRAPASRYLTAGFLTNFSGGRGGVRVGERYAMEGAWPHFRRELRDTPPALVVDDSRGAPYGIASTPTLRNYLERHYDRVGEVDGAVLYVRGNAGSAPHGGVARDG
ncbi:hypothetical protein GCM10027091_59940 [Streptomyces daliensis]